MPFPSAWYQALNPLFVIVLAPVFAALWLRLGARQPSAPVKFAIGLVVPRRLVPADGAGGAAGGRRQGQPVVAGRAVPAADDRRIVREPGGLEHHDAARARRGGPR